MDRRNLAAIVFVGIIVVMIAAYLVTPLGDWLSINALKQSRHSLAAWADARPLFATAAFFLLCVAATAVCFPAMPLLGLAGGALFGFSTGLAVVLGASAIGSTIAFFNARYLLRDWVERRFARRISAVDRGVEARGGLYLLVLRWNPFIPYWLVNLAMGLTAMRPRTYVLLTPLGLLPATLVYVNAGISLAAIRSAADIVSLPLVASLLALSLVPLGVAAAGSLQRSRA